MIAYTPRGARFLGLSFMPAMLPGSAFRVDPGEKRVSANRTRTTNPASLCIYPTGAVSLRTSKVVFT